MGKCNICAPQMSDVFSDKNAHPAPPRRDGLAPWQAPLAGPPLVALRQPAAVKPATFPRTSQPHD
jgi:hypothetical protein